MTARTSFQCLADAVAARPDAPAVVSDDRQLTFAELGELVERTAKAFIVAGFRQGDRFAVWAPNSVAWQVAALAGQAAGCVLVPLNTRFKGREAADIINRSGARGLFYQAEFQGANLAEILAGLELPGVELRVELDLLDDWAQVQGRKLADADFRARLARVTPECQADLLYTSGTTGAPKGVPCSHGQNTRVFSAWSEGVTLSEEDRYLLVNPYFHSFGYKAGWLAALMRGATIYPMATFDAEATLRLIQREGISFLPGPPTLFQSLLNHPGLGGHDLSSLRCAVTGAASVPVQLIRDMKKRLGFTEVYTAYGLTEATGVVSLCQPGDDPETIANTCGRPLAGTEVRIADDQGRPLPADEIGEVRVRGYHVMSGYLDEPEATRAALTTDGWLCTGDLGSLDARGYLRITGRLKDMYICGGFNCYPAEIEQLLLEHPEVLDVAVVGLADARLGEVGGAFVVRRNSLTERELVAWARERMANFKVPRRVVFMPELPRNAAGKVQKFLLAEGADP